MNGICEYDMPGKLKPPIVDCYPTSLDNQLLCGVVKSFNIRLSLR